MKIIHICPRFFPQIGGIETHVYEICRRLATEHEVYVFTTDSTGKLPRREIIDNIEIRRFKTIAPNEAYYMSQQMYFALKKENYDVLHAHSFQTFLAFIALLANKKSKKKFIFTPHYQLKFNNFLRIFFHKLYDPIQEKIFYRANKIICVSNFEKNLLHEKFSIPDKKMIVIPNGIDIDVIKNINPSRKQHDFEILYVGRLERYKNVHQILPSFKKLIDNHPDMNIHFTIVGKGPYENKILNFVRKMGLSKNTTFLKDLSNEEMIRKYKMADVFVYLSAFETFGISILEAIACNTPVIVSNSGGFLDFVKDNYNGFIIDNPDKLLNKFEFLLENKLNFEQDSVAYNWDTIARKTLDIYLNQDKRRR